MNENDKNKIVNDEYNTDHYYQRLHRHRLFIIASATDVFAFAFTSI